MRVQKARAIGLTDVDSERLDHLAKIAGGISRSEIVRRLINQAWEGQSRL